MQEHGLGKGQGWGSFPPSKTDLLLETLAISTNPTSSLMKSKELKPMHFLPRKASRLENTVLHSHGFLPYWVAVDASHTSFSFLLLTHHSMGPVQLLPLQVSYVVNINMCYEDKASSVQHNHQPRKEQRKGLTRQDRTKTKPMPQRPFSYFRISCNILLDFSKPDHISSMNLINESHWSTEIFLFSQKCFYTLATLPLSCLHIGG